MSIDASSKRDGVRNVTCCPTIAIAIAGPFIMAMGVPEEKWTSIRIVYESQSFSMLLVVVYVALVTITLNITIPHPP
jgi:hypothetical protein